MDSTNYMIFFNLSASKSLRRTHGSHVLMTSKNRDHLNLLCDIGELATLIIGTTDIQGFLQQTVEMVARHLNADVGFIYLYEDTTHDLVLQATARLNQSSGEDLLEKPRTPGFLSVNPHFFRSVQEKIVNLAIQGRKRKTH
jgi:hypothetical protein